MNHWPSVDDGCLTPSQQFETGKKMVSERQLILDRLYISANAANVSNESAKKIDSNGKHNITLSFVFIVSPILNQCFTLLCM